VISKSFATSSDFLNIYVDGKDWLDKPHFPFWLCALSMKIFGVSSFAYRLPSLGLFVTGLIYTYKLAQRLYDRDTALLAVMILTYSLHIFISNNDVRAESMLIGLIMGGVYHFFRSSTGGSILHIVIGSLFCAAAVMTKGPFVFIVFGSAIIGFLLGKDEYRAMFSKRWLLALVLVALFITPELLALYWQFDSHPEKDILGATHVSGLKFFVWDTQFGRFFNTGPFKGSGDPAFYFHTILWAFAPWAAIGYVAFGNRLWGLIKRRPATEYLTVSGFMLMFVVFSASRFQLPYYLNILYPFLAIICARSILTGVPESNTVRRILWSSNYVFAVIFLIATGGMEFVFGGWTIGMPLLIAALLAAMYLTVFRIEMQFVFRAIYCSAAALGLFALYANLIFYPRLLEYQSGSEAAIFANVNVPGVPIGYTQYDNLLQFYAKADLVRVDSAEKVRVLSTAARYVFLVDDAFIKELENAKIPYRIIREFDDYRITRLTMQFLNPATRAEVVNRKYLISTE
ncbi:MAG: glycosyltransferase family 39 protein, partial [Acidobacteriota bacterium]